MNVTHRHLFACLLFGCTGQLKNDPSGSDPPAKDPNGSGGHEQDNAEPPGIALTRGLGHEDQLTEIWLDPRASAALTLDAVGGVRLWPVLPPKSVSLDELAPIRVPIREPLWLSLAREGERSFVIAAIDTAQAARVIAIEIDEAGNASFRERFTLSPHDPLLELHVLDGGKRLLALGVDHRIRLYDAGGKLLSELSEYGLTPWQLRVVGPPDALQLAMVLTGPTRLQRFTIQDDRLTKQGEARSFTLDRGPNGNDLALLPSGRTAAVFRRPDAKGRKWSLELHDLDSGEVRVLWGEVEATWRPRVHIVDDDWVLLEDGIAGHWIDLRQAVLMPAPFKLPSKLSELPKESRVAARKVPLPGTSRQTRWHASVVAGLRVVPAVRALLLDPVPPTPPSGAERHHRLGHRPVSIRGLDFESAGDLLAIGYHDEIRVESMSSGGEQPGGCAPVEELVRLTFTDPDHLLLVGQAQAQICEWRTGKVVSTLALPKGTAEADPARPDDVPEIGEIERVVFHPSGPGAGEVGLYRRWHTMQEGFRVHPERTSYANNQLGVLEPIRKSQQANWPEVTGDWDAPQAAALDAAGNRYLAWSNDTDTLTIALASGKKHKLPILEPSAPEVDIWQIEPSSDGRHVAVVTATGDDDSGHGSYYDDVREEVFDSLQERLTIWAVSEPPELLWSTRITATSLDLAWTDDGSRLAMEDAGRLRVLTDRGEVLIDRASRDFQLEELPD